MSRYSLAGAAALAVLNSAVPTFGNFTPADALALSLPTETTIVVGVAKWSFKIEFLGETGNTWSYRVSKLGQGDLSHWVLAIDCDLKGDGPLWEHVVPGSATPSFGFSAGSDGSTGFFGLKWDGAVNPSGTFSFTLDDSYGLGAVTAVAKGGPHGYQTGTIAGPVCLTPGPQIPAPGAALLAIVGLGGVGALRRRLR